LVIDEHGFEAFYTLGSTTVVKRIHETALLPV
jgi:hypothetical protein